MFSDAFGLIAPNGSVEGVVVFGAPSPQISKHAFAARDFPVWELTRLVVQTEERNAASILVGGALKKLRQPVAVVSYADSAWGHVGIVYQATNWLYTGSTISHDKAYLVDGALVHPLTLRGRGITNPAAWAKANGIATVSPSPKHRYFYLCGSKPEKRKMLAKLRYPVLREYPKGDQQRYDAGCKVALHVCDTAAEAIGLLA